MRLKYLVRSIIFVAIVAAAVFVLNGIYTVTRTDYIDEWSDSSTVAGFYNEPKNSIDVLIFGTSSISNAVQPAVLWNEQRFTAYNFATERQYALSAYYMLMEALKYQQPKVVILHARWLTTTPTGDTSLPEVDRDSGALHLALDYMKLSDVKIKAARDIASQSIKQKASEYIFPLYAYHSRDDITKNDFDQSFVSRLHPLKGSCIQLQSNNVPVADDMAEPDKETYELSGINRDYVDRMIELCKSKGIEVLLLALPYNGWNRGHHVAVQQYADAMDVRFLDMNTAAVRKALALDPDKDFRDELHEAISGSTKTSRYVASYLAENYDLGRDYPAEVAASFDDASALYMYYSRLYDRLVELRKTTRLDDYLSLLTDMEDCIVFISAKDEFSERLTAEQKKALAALGLTTDFYASIYRYSYAAVVDSGRVAFEQCSPDRIKYEYASTEGLRFSVTSAGMNAGNVSSVVYSGKDYSLNMRGLNIVVFSKKAKRVVDSVNFDTYAGADIVRADGSTAQPNSFCARASAEAMVLSMS